MGRRLDPEVAKAIGARVRAERDARELSQEDLASAASLQSETVSRIERGVVAPDLRTLFELARGLGVGAARLLGAKLDALTHEEQEHLDEWRELDAEGRAVVRFITRSLALLRRANAKKRR